MKQNFISEGLEISVQRGTEDTLLLRISSDYSRSNHKGRLYVDGKRFAMEVENLWKSIKTKKLLKMGAGFDEIDWYDNMTDIYTTPVVSIERGQKKARLFESEHGSIPKDWSIGLTAKFADTTTNTPIMEVVKTTLGSHFTPKLEKEFKKVLKPVLQKAKVSCYVSTPYRDEM